jgi:hypothetical protein
MNHMAGGHPHSRTSLRRLIMDMIQASSEKSPNEQEFGRLAMVPYATKTSMDIQ